jgi:hypothetical protein
MHTIQTRERTGRDGALSLRIPLGQPDTEFEVEENGVNSYLMSAIS